MLNGLKVIKEFTTERDLYVVGMPIILTMAMILIPASTVKAAPQMIQYVLESPVAVAAIACDFKSNCLNDYKKKNKLKLNSTMPKALCYF